MGKLFGHRNQPCANAPVYVAPVCPTPAYAAPVGYGHQPGAYGAVSCPPAVVTTTASSPGLQQSQENLGVSAGPTSYADLSRAIPGANVEATTNGGLRITFRSTEANFRVGYRLQDGSYTTGGNFDQARGVDAYGRRFTTNSITSAGQYQVQLKHNADGSVDYTIVLDPKVVRSRLDLGGTTVLIDKDKILAEKRAALQPPKATEVPKNPEPPKQTDPPKQPEQKKMPEPKKQPEPKEPEAKKVPEPPKKQPDPVVAPEPKKLPDPMKEPVPAKQPPMTELPPTRIDPGKLRPPVPEPLNVDPGKLKPPTPVPMGVDPGTLIPPTSALPLDVPSGKLVPPGNPLPVDVPPGKLQQPTGAVPPVIDVQTGKLKPPVTSDTIPPPVDVNGGRLKSPTGEPVSPVPGGRIIPPK